MQLQRYVVGPLQVNCYLLVNPEARSAVVIDPGQDIAPVLEAVQGLRVAMILLTHGHFDHLAGVAHLREATGAPVLIHRAEARWLTDPGLNGSAHLPEFCPEPISGPPPDRLLTDGQELSWDGATIVCLHTPGHTPGGMSYYVPAARVVFTGDALFAGSIGRTDLPGGNHRQLLTAIREKLLTLDPETTVYPGHGESTTIGAEKAGNPFLLELRDSTEM